MGLKDMKIIRPTKNISDVDKEIWDAWLGTTKNVHNKHVNNVSVIVDSKIKATL